MMQAAPIPVSMHMEMSPYFLFCLLSSGKRVTMCLAPVHPRGCPRALAHPLGLTFSAGILRWLAQY
jgi:hypothetical protein